MNQAGRWFCVAGVVLAAACRSDAAGSPAPTPPAARIVVVSGDAQAADPQDLLQDPVVFQVLDAAGAPVVKAAVVLTVPIGGGSVPANALVTDATGTVQTPWMMGATGGAQTLEASVGNLTATASATTCDPEDCYPQEVLSSSLSAATLVPLVTYDSSGQTVHPDVVHGHGAAPGFWMAITPYPGGSSAFENPSVYHSTDASHWIVPAGVVNPLVPPGPGYNSDPDIVLGTDKRLWMYYRSVASMQNIISVIRSADGVHWSPPQAVVAAPSHQVVSPTVVVGAPDAPWQMWSVNAGPSGCDAATTTVERRTSNDGISWSAATTVALTQPGRAIWHIDVEWIPARAEYWALYNTYPTGASCSTDALYLARSPDGVHWTVSPSPVVRAGLTPALRDIVYRSSFMLDPHATRVKLWISGAAFVVNAGYTWHTATVSTSVDNLLAIAAAPATTMLRPSSRNPLPPPEPDVGP